LTTKAKTGQQWVEPHHTTEGVPDAEGRQIGTARFSMSEAPHDWLSVGKRFMIFSSKALAQGLVEQVLSD